MYRPYLSGKEIVILVELVKSSYESNPSSMELKALYRKLRQFQFKIAEGLRKEGFNVLQYSGQEANFKKQMSRANDSGSLAAVIIGENEIIANNLTIKHLREEQPQQTMDLENSVIQLKQWKSKYGI